MPALDAFGRRWHVASDDFVILEVCDICLRFICLAIVGGIFLSTYAIINESCEGQFYLNFYVYGILTLTSVFILINIMLIRNSKSGTIIDREFKRKYVPFWLLIKWILQLVEIAQNITGTVWAIQGRLACTLKIGIFTSFMIGIIWLLIIVRLFLLYCIFNPIGNYKYTVKDNGIPDPKLIAEWQRKFKSFSFLFNGKRELVNEAMDGAGYLFGSMFEDVDLVISDVLSGMILLIIRKNQSESQKRYKKVEEKMPSALNESTATFEQNEMESLDPPLESWCSLSQLSHYSRYVKAVQIWSFLLLDGGMDKMKDLWKEIICCGSLLRCKQRKMPFEVIGDNCYYLNAAALKAWHLETDIIHADFRNDIFEVPFFVAVDHQKKAIVAAIRATNEPNNFLVDFYAAPHPLGVPGLPESFKFHPGMLRCAHVMKEKLDQLQLLPKLFSTYPDYDLVLTGSSLGCGIAVALAFIWRNDYPTLKCFAFAPPGALLSLDASEYCKDFVISTIYGDDCVGRTSLDSLETLKYQIMDAITECPTPKYQVLMAGIKMFFGGTPNIECVKNSSTKSLSSSNGNSGKKDTTAVLDVPEKSQLVTTATIRKPQPFEKMYPPANLLYVRETEYFHLGHKNPNYKGPPRWTIRWADRSEFREHVLSPRFWWDHFPIRFPRALKRLAEEEINVRNSPYPVS